MNIDTPTLPKTTQVTDVQQAPASAASANQSTVKADDNNSFKDALKSVNTSNKETIQDKAVLNAETSEATTNLPDNVKLVSISKNQSDSDKKSTSKDLKKSTDKDANNLNIVSNLDKSSIIQPLNDLKSEILNVNDVKASNNVSTGSKSQKIEDIDKIIDYKTIKMNDNDALFFANLVKNDQTSAKDLANISTDKTESTQKSVQVSATLMDALNNSMKTNKPFRIDFDNNIAVIMKVDKNGKLSAEFIPGDKAVETYLKNNIPLLQQSFNEQNLPYNNLSYRRQREDQQQQQNNNQRYKENDDE